MKKLNLYLLSLSFLILLCPVRAAEIWVSPSGIDSASGSKVSPKASLTAAIRHARELRRLNEPSVKGGITIYLVNGCHSLYEPVFLRPEDSGTPESPTVICSAPGGKATLHGGVKIENWKKQGKLWVADVPEFNGNPLTFRQLWINGKKAIRARDVEDFEDMARIVNNDPMNQILWVPAKAVRSIMKAPRAEMVLHQWWTIANLRIKSIEVHGDSAAVRFHHPESRLQFERYWPRPITDGRNSAFYLTNAIELLDTAGEWFHDVYTRKVYYYPRTGENIKDVEAIVPAIETLVDVKGTLDTPVQHIRFENIGFEHTTWMRPSEMGHVPLQGGLYLLDGYRLQPSMKRNYRNHGLDNQVWLGRPSAAVQVSEANDIDFIGCTFQRLGASGLDYIFGVKGGRVEGCVFRNIGGNGIVVGSFAPQAHEVHKPYDPTDRREVCTFLRIRNNYITDVSNEDWGCIGIFAGYVADITIEHNEICEVSYTGISLGWGWNSTVNCMRNNTIHANLIYHYGKHHTDTSGIYTLSPQPGSFITENCVHSIYHPGYVHDPEHWFYLYTDEGSSCFTVKDNWTEGEKYLQNANGPANIWENNGPHDNLNEVKMRAGLQEEFKKIKQL